MYFKPIPLEDDTIGGQKAQFTKRKIRKESEGNLLRLTEKLLARFSEEGEMMLVSELTDLIHALHRTALYTQRVKQMALLKRLKNMTRTKIS